MTPEREAEIRDRLTRSEYDWKTEPQVEDLLAALDAARAERDELRAKVTAFGKYMILLRERYLDLQKEATSETAGKVHGGLADSTDAAITYARTLGLWED